MRTPECIISDGLDPFSWNHHLWRGALTKRAANDQRESAGEGGASRRRTSKKCTDVNETESLQEMEKVVSNLQPEKNQHTNFEESGGRN